MPSEEESLAPPDPSVFLAPPDRPPAPDQSAEIVALMAENSALKKDLMECEEDWAAQAKVSQQKSYSLHFALLQEGASWSQVPIWQKVLYPLNPNEYCTCVFICFLKRNFVSLQVAE